MKAAWIWGCALTAFGFLFLLEWMTANKFDANEFWVLFPMAVFLSMLVFITNACLELYEKHGSGGKPGGPGSGPPPGRDEDDAA